MDNVGGQSLAELIRERIRGSGPISVAQFMEQALYYPQLGYYSRGPSIGPRGDFTTSPEASPAFAKLLARHVADVDALLGRPALFHIVECGPGLGTLAAGILATIRSTYPGLYGRIRYYLVEISAALIDSQKERLLPEHRGVVEWKRGMEELPEGLRGALIANEFVDALPVHVMENRGGSVGEQRVDMRGADLILSFGAPLRPELEAFLQRYAIALEPGQRVEVNLAANEWVEQVGRTFDRCVATIIDYGDTSPGRYSERRKEGTLLGYYGGKVTHDILAHPGSQDLTALVDFTALQDEGEKHGLRTLGLTRQAHLLVGLGLGTTISAETEIGDLASIDVASVIEYRRGLQALTSMEGLGQFHVLLLGKGVSGEDAGKALSGLQYAYLS